MHRFTASLLAFLGALTLPPGAGRADPGAAKTENDRTPQKTSGSDTNETPEANRKRADHITLDAKKTSSGEPTTKKVDASRASSGKSAATETSSPKGSASSTTSKGAAGAKVAPAWTRGQPGVVKLVRGSESLEVRVLDRKQRLVPTTLPQFARFLRAKSGADHPIDGRLVTLVAMVSDHFGGREVNVVSGFRPYAPGQYSRRSHHNEGRAIDFSIKGIANETVRDFCRSLHNVGVGYYPNSLFVHLDVRDGNAYWVDYAAPGQAPRYHPADGRNDDEDESDAIASVDGVPSRAASPSDTPRSDVTRGRNKGRGGDRESTSERSMFINR